MSVLIKTGEISLAEKQFVKSLCEKSFYDFVKEFWHTVSQEQPVWNWHIEYLCEELQRASERVFQGLPKEKDIICNIPPGSTKSTIFSIMHGPWTWTRQATLKSIGASHAIPLALDLSVKSRRVISSRDNLYPDNSSRPAYQDLWPHIEFSPDQNKKSHWENTLGGSRFACSVAGASPIGMHGHFLVVDDPLDPKGARSTAEIQEANHWMRETLPTRKVDKAVSLTMLVQQRLHQDDPTGNALERKKESIFHICLPARLAPNVRPRSLRKRYVRGLLDPVRISEQVLEEAESDLGPFAFAGQYGQSPIPLGGGLFHTERIMQARRPARFRRICRYWDKAYTQDDGCFTCGALVAQDYGVHDSIHCLTGRWWTLDLVLGQWGSHEREAVMLQTARADGLDVEIVIEQEPAAGTQAVQASISHLAGYKARKDKPCKAKAVRADPMSVQVNEGNWYLPLDAPWATEFLMQLRFFPYGKYADMVDANSGGFQWLTKPARKGGFS